MVCKFLIFFFNPKQELGSDFSCLVSPFKYLFLVGFQFSIAAINDIDSKSQWEPLAPTKEALVGFV